MPPSTATTTLLQTESVVNDTADPKRLKAASSLQELPSTSADDLPRYLQAPPASQPPLSLNGAPLATGPIYGKLKRSHSFSDLYAHQHILAQYRIPGHRSGVGMNGGAAVGMGAIIVEYEDFLNRSAPPLKSEPLTDVEMLTEEDGNEVDAFLSDPLMMNSTAAVNHHHDTVFSKTMAVVVPTGERTEQEPMSPRTADVLQVVNSTVTSNGLTATSVRSMQPPPFYGRLFRGMQRSLKVIFRSFSPTTNRNKMGSLVGERPTATTTTTGTSIQAASNQLTSFASADDEVQIRHKVASLQSSAVHSSLQRQLQQQQQQQEYVIDLPVLASLQPLLPPLQPRDYGKRCLVLDLDETLVHSSFQPTPLCDLLLPINFGGGSSMNEALTQHIFVCKRPGVDVFLERVAALFEVVVFTASLSTYADPVLDFLDPQQRLVRHRLYREHCVQLNGLFIKDLSKLGRSLDDVLIVDNSPASYLLHPDHAWAIRSWFSDPADGELPRLLGPLHELASLPTLSVPEWRKRHQSSP